MPASNKERWKAKFDANTERDARKEGTLIKAGWRVIVIWECELKHTPEVRLAELAREIRDGCGHNYD